MKIKLKSCPFCGETVDETDVMYDDGLYYVQCGVCDARSGLAMQIETAYAVWNRRAKENNGDLR